MKLYVSSGARQICLGTCQLQRRLSPTFYKEIYIAMTDGDELPLQTCPDCGLETYLLTEDEIGCVSCRLELRECVRCGNSLIPSDTSFGDSRLCSYCFYQESKSE